MQQESKNVRTSEAPSRIIWFLTGLALGGLAAFLLDPDQGRRRQTLIKDRSRRLGSDIKGFSGRTVEGIKKRTQGFFGRVAPGHEVDDETLGQRVRSEFSRIIRYPNAIEVFVRDGVVTLLGPVLAHEMEDLIICVRSVPGAQEVINELEGFETAEGVPGLTDKDNPYLQ